MVSALSPLVLCHSSYYHHGMAGRHGPGLRSPVLVLYPKPLWPPGCSSRLAMTLSSGMGMAGPPCTRLPIGVWRMPAVYWPNMVGAWTH